MNSYFRIVKMWKNIWFGTEGIKSYFPGYSTHKLIPTSTSSDSDYTTDIEKSFNLFQIIVSSPKDG